MDSRHGRRVSSAAVPDGGPATGAPRTGAVQGALWSAGVADWVAHHEPFLRPLYAAGLDAIGAGPGTRLLDAGCGAGLSVALAMARGADVAALDAAPAMLDAVRERAPAAHVVLGDLEALPFPDASFDAVAGFNSFQFAASPRAALVEARRVLAAGGLLAAAVWTPPERTGLTPYVRAIGGLLPPPPPGARGPFALSDDGELASVLRDAGFAPLGPARDVPVVFTFRDDDHAAASLLSPGPSVRAVQEVGAERVREAVLAAIAPCADGHGGYRIESRFQLVVARR